MHHFTSFLGNISVVPGQAWNDYTNWLKPFSKVRGGHNQDENGYGVAVYSVNEMTMLAYYRSLYPSQFKLLPVLKEYPYKTNRHTRNLNAWKPSGENTGGFTGDGVWDPGSWGQNIGGTHKRAGRDKGFTDTVHIVGQAINSNKCKPRMLCANSTWFHMDRRISDTSSSSSTHDNNNNNKKCLTAPFISCGEYWMPPGMNRTWADLPVDSGWTPLWNLHVHSKHTMDYRSLPCECKASHYEVVEVRR